MKSHLLLRAGFILALLLVAAPAWAQATLNLPMGYDRTSGIQPEVTGTVTHSVSPAVVPVLRGDFQLTENFDDIEVLPGSGWAMQNNSQPVGVTSWMQGNPVVFDAHEGAPSSYIAANYNSALLGGTISNWLITPEVVLANGVTLTFWGRAADDTWFDRLQVRLSVAGASTNVGSGAEDLGDFTTLLLDINPNLVSGGFPGEWIEYTAVVSGLGGPTTGRFAFRYYIPNTNDHGNFIGIDEVSITAAPTGPELVTIAEARALGDGATVIVEGVVSRAMGVFTYFQDDTAGLTIRETSGSFFDAVAAGDVGTGTRIQVTGTLSSFNGLVQINQGDMDAFEILAQGEELVPHEITLSDLVGDAYQAELVHLVGLTFTEASGEFNSATTYKITDESISPAEADLRVPNGTDNNIAGSAIPENTFTFTGIVGMFNLPQLMAIYENDVVGTISTEGGSNGLSFDLFQNYPNPFSGVTTVEFALPHASHVTIEVLDVMGRRVALLVDDQLEATQHTVTWNASGVSSGVYLYRMIADGFSKTLRTTVMN